MICHSSFDLHFPDAGVFFICISIICMFYFEECLFQSYVHILLRLFMCLLLTCLYLYILDISPYHIYDMQLFSFIISHLFNVLFPLLCKILLVMNYSDLSICCCCLCYLEYIKNLCPDQYQKGILLNFCH